MSLATLKTRSNKADRNELLHLLGHEATLDQLLSRVTALPVVARQARDIEQGRRLPAELVSALKSARIYSMLVPRRYGGLELDPQSSFQVVAALARLDGSVGWNAMIGHI